MENATIEYSLEFFVRLCVCMYVCVTMISRKVLNIRTQNFNMLFDMIIAQLSSALGIVRSRSGPR